MFVGFTTYKHCRKSISGFSSIFQELCRLNKFSFSWNCISITLKFFFLTVAFSLLLLHSMFSFQGTSRQKKLHIVLLPFQIRPASLGSNLVWLTAESLFKGSLKSPLGDFNQPSRNYFIWKMVGQSGLEPPTSRLSVVCSSQLSYWPSSSQAPFPSLTDYGGD